MPGAPIPESQARKASIASRAGSRNQSPVAQQQQSGSQIRNKPPTSWAACGAMLALQHIGRPRIWLIGRIGRP